MQIARFWCFGHRKPAISFSGFPRSAKHDSLAYREGFDAAEEAQDDGIERSVPGASGPDYQPEARAGSACRELSPIFGDGRSGQAAEVMG